MKTTSAPHPAERTRALRIGGAVVVATAVVSGLAVPAGNRVGVLVPMAVAIGAGLIVLAVTRFETFVALVILTRASLDVAKLGSSSVDTTGALSVLFIAVSLLWLWVQRSERAETTPSPVAPLLPPLAALFATGLVSVLYSSHPMESATEAVRLGTLVVIVAVLGRLIASERSLRLILIATLASAIGPLLFAGRQLTSGGGILNADGLSRIEGTFQHPNPFGAYLSLTIVLVVSIWIHVGWRWRALLAFLGLACAGVLLMTYARGALIATVIALVIVGLLQDRRILAVVAIGLVVVALSVPSVGVRLSDLSEDVKETGAPGNSLVWRFAYWRTVLSLQTNPLLGIGLREVALNERAAKAPHNDVVRVYVELGLVGLAIYLWLLTRLAIEARASLRRAPPGVPRGLAVAFAASLVGIALQSLAANIVTQLVILWYFMTIVSMAMTGSRLGAQKPVET